MLIDMHCHIIYGVDDGAQTAEDMRAMLARAHDNQISHIIATSHIEPGHVRFPSERYLRHLEAANAWCREQGWDMEVHPGSEILYTDETPRLVREGYVPTLDSTYTVLVEFLTEAEPQLLRQCARNLGNEGLTVIFAHIERYKAMRDFRLIEELRGDYGVLMQMNCSTVYHKLPFFHERWKRRVLDNDMIDMVASDAHNTTTRACNLLRCHQALTAQYDQEYADQLCGGRQAELFGY